MNVVSKSRRWGRSGVGRRQRGFWHRGGCRFRRGRRIAETITGGRARQGVNQRDIGVLFSLGLRFGFFLGGLLRGFRFSFGLCFGLFAHALRLLHGIAFGTCSTAIGTIVVQTAVNGLGAVSIAAVTAANKVSQLFTCPFDAAGTTMAVYGGQNYGAMKLDRIHRGVRACVLLMFAYSALGLGVLALFGGKLSLLFLDSAESAAVRDQIGLLAQQFLVWNASCYFLLTLVNVLRFLIQGVGFTQQAVFAGVFETIARCFVGFAVVRWIGYTAICLANPAAWLLADCFLVPIYFHDMHLLQRRFAQRRAEA